jgi:glycosyltransferase involved in cell wall biosynthesis
MISIILPTRNGAETFEKTIKSYLIQRGLAELIVVDDASSDRTEQMVADLQSKFRIIMYHRTKQRVGAAEAKKIGFGMSKSRYILFGEDDVELSPLYTKKLLEHMNETKANIIGGRMIYKIEKGGELVDFKSKGQLVDRKTLVGNYSVSAKKDTEVPFLHAIYLAEKETLEKIEFFDGYKVNGFREETDPQIQAIGNGAKIVFCPHTVCFHLPSKSGGQRSMNRIRYELWLFRNNYLFLKRHNKILVEKGYSGSILSKQLHIFLRRFKEHLTGFTGSFR